MKRLDDLDNMVFNRVRLLGQGIEEIYNALSGFDYTIDEIKKSVEKING